jgi:hypothetical protein
VQAIFGSNTPCATASQSSACETRRDRRRAGLAGAPLAPGEPGSAFRAACRYGPPRAIPDRRLEAQSSRRKRLDHRSHQYRRRRRRNAHANVLTEFNRERRSEVLIGSLDAGFVARRLGNARLEIVRLAARRYVAEGRSEPSLPGPSAPPGHIIFRATRANSARRHRPAILVFGGKAAEAATGGSQACSAASFERMLISA